MKLSPIVVLLSSLCAAAVANADTTTETQRLRSTEMQTRKPSLPVSIATTLPLKINAGENLALDVKVSSALDQGYLVVSFIPDDGLELIAPQQELQFALSDGGLSTSIPLTVLPSKDGRYAVTVAIRHLVDGKTRSVARGITFRVGDEPVAAKASATTPASDGSDNVTSMPAQETIIRH